MKIYRAVVTYNNGDYNEWEETYKVTSKWYTSKEEAEKHFTELSALADWMRYRNITRGNFHAGNPVIEESEILEEFTPMESIDVMISSEPFEYSKFKYITECPSLNIESIVTGEDLSMTSISNWYFAVQVGNELFGVLFNKPYSWEESQELYEIMPETGEYNKDSKYWLYAPEIRNSLIATIKSKVVDPLLPLFKKNCKVWNDYHQCDDKDERDILWYKARLDELQLFIEASAKIDATLTEYCVSSIRNRLDDINSGIEDDWDTDRQERSRRDYQKEIEYIETVLNSFKQ